MTSTEREEILLRELTEIVNGPNVGDDGRNWVERVYDRVGGPITLIIDNDMNVVDYESQRYDICSECNNEHSRIVLKSRYYYWAYCPECHYSGWKSR